MITSNVYSSREHVHTKMDFFFFGCVKLSIFVPINEANAETDGRNHH